MFVDIWGFGEDQIKFHHHFIQKTENSVITFSYHCSFGEQLEYNIDF